MKRVLVVEHDRLHRELISEWLQAGGAQAVWPAAPPQPVPRRSGLSTRRTG